MWPLDGISGFLTLWAAVYGAHLVVYFALGGLLAWGNRYFPERRIPAISGRERRPRRSAAEEIKQSVKSLVATSFCFAGGLFAQSQGWTQTPLELTWLSALGIFVAVVVLHDAWFYFGHRLMHVRRFYKHHKRHHANVTPIVWSNDSFSVADALTVQSFFLILPFVLPIPPAVFIFCRLFDQTKGMIGHSGYEHFANRLSCWPFPLVATVHHDLHHQRFSVNFANQFTFWDRLFGTLDPNYDAMVRRMSDGNVDAKDVG